MNAKRQAGLSLKDNSHAPLSFLAARLALSARVVWPGKRNKPCVRRSAIANDEARQTAACTVSLRSWKPCEAAIGTATGRKFGGRQSLRRAASIAGTVTYREDSVSLGRAAELCHTPLAAFMDFAAKRGVPPLHTALKSEEERQSLEGPKASLTYSH